MFNSALSQVYVIDSTFTQDATIHPFGPNDTLYSLKISGSLTLNSDTSLVRVIVGNEDSLEYMVYEAYPMITNDYNFSFEEMSDETSYLNSFFPEYMKIILYDASIDIDSIYDFQSYQENLDSLQLINKANIETVKIQNINQYIAQMGWNWTAGETSFSTQFYHDKKSFFGNKYNLLGLDYYISGSFTNFHTSGVYVPETSSFVLYFNWREKHDANIPDTKYYDGDSKLNGWMTGIVNQGSCGSCSAFGCIAVLESIININYNKHIDIDDGIRFSEKDANNCSQYKDTFGEIGCLCSEGKKLVKILTYFSNNGVVDEDCWRYLTPYCYGPSTGDCEDFGQGSDKKCTDPWITAKTSGRHRFLIDESGNYGMSNSDYIKSRLIEYGPLIVIIGNFPLYEDRHAVALVGYESDENGNTTWIIKNSWGESVGVSGYYYLENLLLAPSGTTPALHIENQFFAIKKDITMIPGTGNSNVYEEIGYDKDSDGYYNWGLGTNPLGCTPECSQLADWNDNCNRIGPCNENYIGQEIAPEFEVYFGNPLLGGKLIENNSFFAFTNNDLTNNELEFYIVNSGSAQLNLHYNQLNNEFPVTELSNESGCYDITLMAESKVCNANNTTFKISFNLNCQGQPQIPILASYLINIDVVDEDILEDFEFTLVYYDCSLDQNPERIDTYSLWDENIVKNHDIYIQNGGVVELTALLGMAPGTNIFVEPGGQLHVNGGKITNACEIIWEGIDVWGNSNLSQYPVSNQGYLRITNGGTISHADYGVQVAKIVNGEYVYGYTGGIVKCDNANFTNNTTDIIFYPYSNFNPSTGEDHPNSSYLKLTYFSNHEICNKQSYVRLTNVDGIQFEGCSFTNQTDQLLCGSVYNKGNGIHSFNAGYYVQDYCDDAPCTNPISSLFENLDHGIYSPNAEFNELITIDNANFVNNRSGIYMSLVSQQTIINNNFIINDNNDLSGYSDIIGLNMEQCRDFTVEENQFINQDGIIVVSGLQVLNAGPYANEIYNNSFTGLEVGIIAAGENRNGSLEGLCIKCNDFTNCATDIYATPDGGINENYVGIALQQGIANGSPDGPAGNTFSDFSGVEFNLDNSTDNLFNYAHHSNLLDIKLIPLPYYNEQTIELEPEYIAQYSKESSCPSNFGGGIDVGTEMSILLSESLQIVAYEDTLSQEVDGGDTEELNQDVQTTMPAQALQTTQELLIESPFLSDTVMESTIAKESVYPNAMVRDVLVANPQSAKTAKVLNALDNRFVPMPDYMMDQIMLGQNIIGAKELLEQSKTRHVITKTKSINKLIKYYMEDTLGVAPQDSLLSILNNENNTSAYYKRAFIYLENNDSLNTLNVLNSIPINFNLSNRENTIHNLYCNLFDVLIPMHSDTIGIDSIRETQLLDIEQYDHLIPGIYARNTLLNNGSIYYNEPIYLPNSLKGFEFSENKRTEQNTNATHIKVFPNPAVNYFIIEYNLEEIIGKAMIRFCDKNGKTINSYLLNDKQNQKIFDIGQLSSGMYFIQLFFNDDLIESHKLEIIK